MVYLVTLVAFLLPRFLSLLLSLLLFLFLLATAAAAFVLLAPFVLASLLVLIATIARATTGDG